MKIRLIVNPISGTQRRSESAWKAPLQRLHLAADVVFTQYAGHATELAIQAAQTGYEQIWVAGGDGTLNEVARALVNTPLALGIIPKGSGNGLARELGMPLRYEKALAALQQATVIACDVGIANEEYFFNLAGVGIEAEIARQFAAHAQQGRRGKWPYFKLGAKTIFSYVPPTLQVQYNGQEKSCTALTLVFANGAQYGSNFIIAPQASLTDGQFDMVEVKNVSKWKLSLALPEFFTKKFRPVGVTEVHRTAKATITAPGEIVYHLDGEPRVVQNKLEISLLPKALKLLVPQGK